MSIDPAALARALHADHEKRQHQSPWGELPQPAKATYLRWAENVAKEYGRFTTPEGGEQ